MYILMVDMAWFQAAIHPCRNDDVIYLSARMCTSTFAHLILHSSFNMHTHMEHYNTPNCMFAEHRLSTENGSETFPKHHTTHNTPSLHPQSQPHTQSFPPPLSSSFPFLPNTTTLLLIAHFKQP